MTTAEGVSTTDTDGTGGTADDVEVQVIRGLVQIQSRNTGTDLESRTGVTGGSMSELGTKVLDVLEVVCPDRKRSSARGLCVEVVTLVLDNQADVEVPGEVDGELDLCNVGGLDNIGGHAAQSTVGVGPSEGWWHAGYSLEDRVAKT